MTKIAALDVGDQWTGVALSDTLQMFARPSTTVKTKDLFSFLTAFLDKEAIKTIIIGLPKTMQGRISQQTEKVLAIKEQLERAFPLIKWIAWDERLSSKRAQEVQKSKKEFKTDRTCCCSSIYFRFLSYFLS